MMGNLPSVFRARARWTGGAYTMMEQVIAPRLLVAPHTHAHDDHVSYIVSGRLGFRVGDQEYELGAGESIFRPRGIPHTLWNAADEPAVMLELTSPGRLEDYIETLRDLAESGASSLAAVIPVAARYGVTFDDAWVDELCERYNVSAGPSFWGASQ